MPMRCVGWTRRPRHERREVVVALARQKIFRGVQKKLHRAPRSQSLE
jgi:hypothetical protein